VALLAAGVVGALALTAATLGAQQAPLSGGVVKPPDASADEGAKLIPGPNGSLYRLSQTEADQRAGGGTVTLDVATPQGAWTTLTQVSSTATGVTVRDGDVAVSADGRVAMAYRWWRHSPRIKQIRMALSDDGKTWNQPTTPVDTSGKAFDPRVAWVAGKGLVVVWADERRGGRLFDVYARRSADGGVTWEPEQLLSRFPNNAPTDGHARPQLVSDGGERLWAIWVGFRGARSFVYLNRSTDGGRTWTEPAALTGDSRSIFGQTLLRAGERMLLVWHDTHGEPDRIYSAASDNGGVTWTTPDRIDHVPAKGPAATGSSVVLAPNGEALVVWHDARNRREDIFLVRSTDGGRTWATQDQRMDLDDAGTAISRFPKIALAPDGRVALVWEDDRAGFEGIYMRVRSAGAKPEWGPEIVVAPANGKVASRIPNLAWGPGGLYVSWQVWDHTHAPARVEKRPGGRIVSLDGR
jgi:hypothetical protein